MGDDPRDELDLPRGVALAWGIAANPQRGPKREMSVERIVEAAVELADAEGLGAVSMSAVAAKLGYTPMSLYRYVTAKDDLILLMLEEATGLPPEGIAEAGGWRERLSAMYSAQLEVYLSHPWTLEIPIYGSPTTPNSSAWIDASLAALEETTLTADERLAVSLLITGQVRWTGQILAGYARSAAESHVDAEEFARREARLYDALITPEEFPSLHRAVRAGVFSSDFDTFAFGFQRLLDGVATYVADAAAGRKPPVPTWRVPEPAAVAADRRYREARRAVREAEKGLRDARKLERQALREARERAARGAAG